MRRSVLLGLAFCLLILTTNCQSTPTVTETVPETAPETLTETVPNQLTVAMSLTTPEGEGASIGSIRLEDSEYGLLITPELTGVPLGIHGFHVHMTPACGAAEKEGKIVPGLAAGGHFDPDQVGQHEGPYSAGHLGDLPPLFAEADGQVSVPVLAPRLTVSDVVDRALIVHAGADNFADQPMPLGGGGARFACGVIPLA